MVNARRLGRMGMWAVGLGIGAAVASTPGVAAADSSPFDLSWLDPFSALVPGSAAGVDDPSSPFDFAYSFNGVDYDYGTATATTTAGTGDVAFAFGNGASANATLGTHDFALAAGTNALADSGGAVGANSDSAIDFGNMTGAGDAVYSGAFGGLTTGSNDFAMNVGNLSGAGDTVTAIGGLNDSATNFSDLTGTLEGALAGDATGANGDIASVLGGTDSIASATLGTNDVATVLGSDASTAIAGGGLGDNLDLASVFFDNGVTATATGAPDLVDILPSSLDGFSTLFTDLMSLL